MVRRASDAGGMCRTAALPGRSDSSVVLTCAYRLLCRRDGCGPPACRQWVLRAARFSHSKPAAGPDKAL
ncbi:hypothetical protein GCM10017708_27980 [Arthrobacter citreus]